MAANRPPVNVVLEISRLCEGTEIPELFAIWAGLSAVSAALGRRIWLDMGFFTVFPNLYVVLVASSGRFRKSTTVNLVTALLRPVQPPLHFISQKLTPEALVGSLLAAKQTVRGPEGKSYRCEGFVNADELSTFLNRKSYELGIAPMLINFFDCLERFEYETKARGKEVLQNVCLGMFAGSTIEWIRDAIPADAIGGGLTSRLIFVYADKAPKPVAWPTLSEEQKVMKERVVESLSTIRGLSGEVRLDPKARELCEQEYVKHCETSPFFIMPMLSGYASRWYGHMLTVAMILTASEDPLRTPPVLFPRHIHAAMDILRTSEQHMPKILKLITSTERGAIGELLAGKVEALRGGVRREDLLRSVSHRINVREFTDVVSTLVATGRIARVVGPEGVLYMPRSGAS